VNDSVAKKFVSEANSGREHHACHAGKRGTDWLLVSCGALIVVLYVSHWFSGSPANAAFAVGEMAHSVYSLVNTMWWGIAFGVVAIAVLGRIPREFIMRVLGTGRGVNGIVRATFAGVLLDLCSHGILLVGAKLYERGASIGQVMAFLIASPWNSFSLTLILIALVGLPLTLAFILLSMGIGVVTGLIFERLVARGQLPENPNQSVVDANFKFWSQARLGLRTLRLTPSNLGSMLIEGIVESRMVMRWIFLGIIIASATRAFMPDAAWETYFGPTLFGVMVTLVVTTLMEVCSEGSTPIAADIVNRAGAPGNGFAFLMGGVVTDYTEIMTIRDMARSLKTALFLPLISLPQVLLVAVLVNRVG